MLLHYAAKAAGGLLDGLVINCLDDLADLLPQICLGYKCPPDTKIEQLPVSPVPWLAAQEKLTTLLEHVVPVCGQISIAALCDTVACALAPIAISGTGPTWQDRTLRKLQFRRHVNEPQIRSDRIASRRDHALPFQASLNDQIGGTHSYTETERASTLFSEPFA